MNIKILIDGEWKILFEINILTPINKKRANLLSKSSEGMTVLVQCTTLHKLKVKDINESLDIIFGDLEISQ